jgi:hypothetical protein
MLKDIMGEYYNTSAVLGQAVPGHGFSGAAKGGLERTMADFGANMAGQALQAYTAPWGGMFGSVGNIADQQFKRMQWEDQQRQWYLQQSSQQGQGSGQAVGQAAGGCCFIFLEANDGVLNRIARRYRDEHGTLEQKIGYKVLASVLVPLMRKKKWVKSLVRWLMVKPMIWAGKGFFGEQPSGKIFYPFLYGWLKVFENIGKGFIREILNATRISMGHTTIS